MSDDRKKELLLALGFDNDQANICIEDGWSDDIIRENKKLGVI